MALPCVEQTKDSTMHDCKMEEYKLRKEIISLFLDIDQ